MWGCICAVTLLMGVWTPIISWESRDLLISSIKLKPHVPLYLAIYCFMTFPTDIKNTCLQGLEHIVICCIIVCNTQSVVTHLPGSVLGTFLSGYSLMHLPAADSESASSNLSSWEAPRGPSHHCTSKYLLSHLLVTVLTLPFPEPFHIHRNMMFLMCLESMCCCLEI